jgi:4-alpha-glucanotransferase
MTRASLQSNAFGIVKRYKDALGNWRQAPAETCAALLEAMDRQGTKKEAPLLVVRRGQRRRLKAPAEITLEEGGALSVGTSLPRDLPLGYHTLRYLNGLRDIRLIVTPGACFLPKELRDWGWSVQLYALRSSNSWGMGDFANLRRLGRWSAKQLGAGVLLVNPLNAALPTTPQQPSPYFPSSRRYRNLLYLCIEEIAGAAESSLDLERLSAAGRTLNREWRIDRDAVFKLKMDALELLWSRFNGDSHFDEFCVEQGASLVQFATFCALAEHHGLGWRHWPADFREPDSPAVARFAEDHAGRVRFYQWIQWLLDEQLARAAIEIPIMQDLPIGVDPEGADAWAWQDLFAGGLTVGAPPDEYNTQGQDWGFSPMVPWKLRHAGYEPFIQTIRAAMRHAGGLRIDHIMGLFRLFWIPNNSDPRQGAYVRYREDELLAILALESERAKAYVVGEDLGTIDEKFRQQLMDYCVLSYRLVWFENDSPGGFPEQALAAVTTHDLPTIAGLWTGSDLQRQRELGLEPNEAGMDQIRDRLSAMLAVSEQASIEEVIRRTYELVGRAPSKIVSATLDDALGVKERPNMPGADGRRPNWSVALPKSQEELEEHNLTHEIAQALKRT